MPATLQLHYFPGNASLAPHLLLEDSYLLMLGRWTRGFARPARSLPQLGPYLARALARPALMRVVEREGLGEPRV